MGVWDVRCKPDTRTWCHVHRSQLYSNNTVASYAEASPQWNHSDHWAAYSRVQQLPSVSTHNTVNHSLHFVDPVTGVHTQNVESYWNRMKGKFKRMKGVHEEMLLSYLDEFMWRERHGRTASAALTSLFRDISLWYPQ